MFFFTILECCWTRDRVGTGVLIHYVATCRSYLACKKNGGTHSFRSTSDFVSTPIHQAGDAAKDPVGLWLNGGPGASSVGYGFWTEHGRYLTNLTRINSSSLTLFRARYQDPFCNVRTSQNVLTRPPRLALIYPCHRHRHRFAKRIGKAFSPFRCRRSCPSVSHIFHPNWPTEVPDPRFTVWVTGQCRDGLCRDEM
jgi:hypothetical protein